MQASSKKEEEEKKTLNQFSTNSVPGSDSANTILPLGFSKTIKEF
jgi:hypothetical protein